MLWKNVDLGDCLDAFDREFTVRTCLSASIFRKLRAQQAFYRALKAQHGLYAVHAFCRGCKARI